MTVIELPPPMDPGQGKPPARAKVERKAPTPMISRRFEARKLYRAVHAWYQDPANKRAYETEASV